MIVSVARLGTAILLIDEEGEFWTVEQHGKSVWPSVNKLYNARLQQWEMQKFFPHINEPDQP